MSLRTFDDAGSPPPMAASDDGGERPCLLGQLSEIGQAGEGGLDAAILTTEPGRTGFIRDIEVLCQRCEVVAHVRQEHTWTEPNLTVIGEDRCHLRHSN